MQVSCHQWTSQAGHSPTFDSPSKLHCYCGECAKSGTWFMSIRPTQLASSRLSWREYLESRLSSRFTLRLLGRARCEASYNWAWNGCDPWFVIPLFMYPNIPDNLHPDLC